MIKVYTTTTCAYCDMVKKYFNLKGKEYEVVNLDEKPELRQELMQKTGAMTVPVTMRGDEFVIGWQPARLAKLIA